MRKIIVILTLLCVLLLSGCGYVAHKEYYNNSTDYDEIWELAGFYEDNEKSELFPETIEGLDIKEFFCRYDEVLPLGEGVQLHIKIQYSGESFQNEVERIALCSKEDKENFTHKNVSAYCVRLGEEGSWEYALADSENSIISYIYIRSLPQSEIEINKTLLPENYVDYGF